MATSEIEKLERRYAENPHGLTFAPLAEVHRKNGDVARALELLTAGLELHPNYIPASIVLGRCHQDLGDLPAAEAAFAHVLRLDDENVIALKSLADINERLERFDDAETWLRRLVSVDRSNDEAREQLHRVETARNGQSAAVQPPAKEAADAVVAEAVQERPKRPSAEVVALDLPPVDLAALDLAEPLAGLAATPEPAATAAPPPPASPPANTLPLVLERPTEFSEQTAEQVASIAEPPLHAESEPVAPVAGFISQEFEPPKEPLGAPMESLDLDVETHPEVVLGGTAGGSEFRVPDASEDLGHAGGAPPAGVSDYRVPDASEEFREAALARAAAEARVAADAPPEAPSAPLSVSSYSAQETHGQSVVAFFRGMLAARPPSGVNEPSGPTPGRSEPGRPAQDGLSLRSVLGQEGAEKTDAAVSFDDFFGSQEKGAGAEKGGDPGNDDLDQFHSWLQNLKP
jgi:hypothetical protein